MSEPPLPPSEQSAVGAGHSAQGVRPDGLGPVGEPAHHLLVQAPVPALDVDGFTVTILGLVAFLIGTAVTWFFYPELQSQGNGWWLGVCVSGCGLGLVGLAYCRRRRDQRRSGRWERD